MARTVPTLATSPTALTSEVQSALTTVVGYIDDVDTKHASLKAAHLAWINAVQAAVLLRCSHSPYNDVDATTKNAALISAFDALKAALA